MCFWQSIPEITTNFNMIIHKWCEWNIIVVRSAGNFGFDDGTVLIVALWKIIVGTNIIGSDFFNYV